MNQPSSTDKLTDTVVWINGTFGAGKTTTIARLTELLPDTLVFDSELVGQLLRHLLRSRPPVGDFQDYPAWRYLVPHTAAQLLAHTGGTLVIPQTVLVEQYWKELMSGFDGLGLTVHHVVLHADRDTLTRRIDNDTVEAGARAWRLDHLDAYERALPWLRDVAHVIDTTELAPADTARTIAARLGQAES